MDVDPSLLTRKIIHFDMDAFYASIEVRDDASLRGKPVVVGGSPQSRGVVCTASYEARRFGIRSAMPCSQAARLCPTAVFIRPNFEKYTAASLAIREIFRRYTALVEPLSLDEAFLDVTNNERGLYAVKIARMIQDDVARETGLTGSAGVAPNKLIAKIASDLRKPAGLTVILPAQVREFVRTLPLRKIHGIGPATERRLAALGLNLCGDVWARSVEELTHSVGANMAPWLLACSQGLDARPVEPHRDRKSLGQEETFATDVRSLPVLEAELVRLSRDVAVGLGKRGLQGRTITLKVKYANFDQITRSYSLLAPTADADLIATIARQLLTKTEAGRRKIRLIGVSVANIALTTATEPVSANDLFGFQ